MFVIKVLRRKRTFLYVLSCLSVLYLFYTFIRFISFSTRGRYLTVQLTDVSPVKIFYSELLPHRSQSKETSLTVVLLYTMSMTTKTWERTNTPGLLQQAGYRVLCIHLPVIAGNEQEPSYPLKGAILADTLKQLNALDCILVAPSKTGSYALPVVVRGGYSISAFIAISPSDSHRFTRREYQILKTPTLILYGSIDKPSSAIALENLQHIPNKEVVEVHDAGHNCYVDNPDAFHDILLKYLATVAKRRNNIS